MYPPHYRAKLLGNWGDPSAVPSSRKTVTKMSESCLKLSMSKGFHNWTTRVKFFCWTKISTFWKFVLFCSKHQVWWVLRFSYHILLISLCPAHQFSRKLLPMSICNLVSTKCCCTTSLWKDYGRKKVVMPPSICIIFKELQ